ncbi:MAG: hypothetical protein GX593_15250, partial [Actinomycetales bacterium]|nr:hypothetical protein [Actinomycetales bacterium]
MTSRRTGGELVGRVPAPVLFVGSGLAQYIGAAIAVGLFAVAGAPETGWLRILAAALVLLAWRRPWRLTWTSAALRGAAVFGLVLTGMNIAFYLAIAHLPLGLAVAIEFAGPVAVAAITGGVRERWGGLLAAVGVAVLSTATLSGMTSAGEPEVVVLDVRTVGSSPRAVEDVLAEHSTEIAAELAAQQSAAVQGLAWILVAAALWAGYVVLGRRV